MTYKTYDEALEALTTDQIISITESNQLTTSMENLPVVYKIAYNTSMEDAEPKQLITNLVDLNLDLLQTLDLEDLAVMLTTGCELQFTLEYECYDEDTYNSQLRQGAENLAEITVEDGNTIPKHLRHYINIDNLTEDLFINSSEAKLLDAEEVFDSITIANTTYHIYKD